MHMHINKPCRQSHKPPLKCNYLIRLMREKEFLHCFILIVASHVDKGRKTQSSFLHLFIGSQGASTLIGGHCHAPPWFDLMELHHVHTHLMMDCDLTQSRHCHSGQHRTVSDLAISNISRHLSTRSHSVLTAPTPHSSP